MSETPNLVPVVPIETPGSKTDGVYGLDFGLVSFFLSGFFNDNPFSFLFFGLISVKPLKR